MYEGIQAVEVREYSSEAQEGQVEEKFSKIQRQIKQPLETHVLRASLVLW
jgi:hypothetical protein